MVRGEIPIAICEFLDESNVEMVMAELPEPYRGEFIEWAADGLLTPVGEWRLISFGSHLRPPTPEEEVFPRRDQVYAALKAWFDRHPDERPGQ